VNAPVCGTIQHPEWVIDFKNGVCISCHRMFGKKIEFSEDECPSCLEEKILCVTLPKCTHKQCIECFKRCRYGHGKILPLQPEFPFPDLEDEYEENPDLLKFRMNIEIVKYKRELNKWFDLIDADWEREENLRKCPLCRQ
jgi:hypothetical protein